jgi:hypothetical protein
MNHYKEGRMEETYYVQKEREHDEEDVNSYRINFRKREDNGS